MRTEATMDEVFLSLERMSELAKEPGLSVVFKNSHWLYSWYHKSQNAAQTGVVKPL